MTISHRERLETTLAGKKPDRPPVALWRHFPVDDQDPMQLAAATLNFQEQFDFDFVKISPPSSFCLKDWGANDQWRGHPEGTRSYIKRPIQHPEDWTKLESLNPKKGFLGQQLRCLAEINMRLPSHTPKIQTIFNPLSQAKNLVGPDQLPVHIRKYPQAVHAGLRTIQETILRFLEEAKQYAIDGIFFAIQHASSHILTQEEYTAFGKAYDLPILEQTQDLWLNLAHIHGLAIDFELIADYPLQILNWHDRETDPDLKSAQTIFNGTVCGGLAIEETLVLGTSANIEKEAIDAFEQTQGIKFILGTGCVMPVITPWGNIMAARQIVEKL